MIIELNNYTNASYSCKRPKYYINESYIYIQSENDSSKLEKENIQLKNEIEKLQQKIAVLSKTSKNSSKPPSSDIVKAKSKDKNSKKNKQGGQPGHKKHTRKPFDKEEIDHFYEHELSACPQCLGELIPYEEKNITIQQISIKENPIEKIEHTAHAYYCENCNKFYYGKMPDEIVKQGLFDSTSTALVGYMKFALHASYSTIKNYFKDVLKISVSRGQLAKLVNKVGESLKISYLELLEKLKSELVLNIDETGHKNNGKRYWSWGFRAKLFALFKIDKSRGSQVLIDVLGKEFNGLLGCDYFSAYQKFMKDFNVLVQFCIAHLIRDIKFLITLDDPDTKNFGEKLLIILRKMFEVINEHEKNTQEFTMNKLKILRDEFLDISINKAPSKLNKHGKETKTYAQNISKRFKKNGVAYFQFITTPEIDPTNNVAEQIIRFLVIDRYITQGSRSEIGMRNSERFWTILATCSLQDRSAYNFIQLSTDAYFNCTTPPSLLNF